MVNNAIKTIQHIIHTDVDIYFKYSIIVIRFQNILIFMKTD